MTLDEWLNYLERLHPTTIELGLDRVRQVADRLSLDFGDSRSIIVGGTNGKGSTVTLLAAILQSAGKSTGTYMSPHITHYNERVKLNGEMASDAELCAAFAEVEAARGDVSLTYFEFGTLCAMVVFARHKPDYIIYEVGLGGRLDAVNIANPALCILSNVAMDHMDWLGDNREVIGSEKAGIFRPGVPAIYGESMIPATVSALAETKGVPLYQLSRQFLWSRSDDGSWSWQGVTIAGDRSARFNLPPTRIHLDNAASVLQALMLLEPELADTAIISGLKTATLEGRFEEIGQNPFVVVDVAHNTHAMDNLIESLSRMYPGRKLHIVIAMLADKDSRDAVKRLSEVQASWYVGQLGGERGAPAKILYNHLLDWGVNDINAYESVEKAFLAAKERASASDLILVTGSFFTVAAVKHLISQ